MADYISQFTGSEIDQRLAKVSQLETNKQDKLISGTNIKTINGQPVLGSGDMTIQGGDTDAVKYVAQTLTDAQKAQARTNIGAQETLIGSGTGQNIKTVNNQSILGSGNIEVQGGGVGFDSITTPSTPDGTMIITLTNGDTITMDLNHNHPQYTKCVYCASQAAYDAISPKDSDTLYVILETS